MTYERKEGVDSVWPVRGRAGPTQHPISQTHTSMPQWRCSWVGELLHPTQQSCTATSLPPLIMVVVLCCVPGGRSPPVLTVEVVWSLATNYLLILIVFHCANTGHELVVSVSHRTWPVINLSLLGLAGGGWGQGPEWIPLEEDGEHSTIIYCDNDYISYQSSLCLITEEMKFKTQTKTLKTQSSKILVVRILLVTKSHDF